MAKRLKPETPTVGHNAAARAEAINTTFADILAIEAELEKLKAEHIKPLQDKRTKMWRNLKADTQIDSTDLQLFYKVFKRDRLAREMADEDGDRILDNLREVFGALKTGQQLDWISASEQGETKPAAGKPAVRAADPNDPNQQGVAAGLRGDGRTENPYDPGTDEHDAWDAGWMGGQKQLAANLKKGTGKPTSQVH